MSYQFAGSKKGMDGNLVGGGMTMLLDVLCLQPQAAHLVSRPLAREGALPAGC